jgi:probable HAF family extracellular repeat protein
MKNWGAVGRGLIVVLTIGLVAAAADAQKIAFKYKTIDVAGAQSTAIFAINNRGAMVGSYMDSSGVRHGFLLSKGKVINIDHPNGMNTYCFGINNAGAIVGYYTTSSFSAQGFLYAKGKFKNLGPAGSTSSQAIGINSNGDINGNFGDSKGSHGFLLKGGKYTTLDVPNSMGTLGGGINDADVMTEEWIDSGFNVESSLYKNRKYTTINIPGETDSYVSGINNLGDIVYSWESAEDYGGALRHNGRIYMFRDPKGDRTFGYGINDHNTIVGAYTDSNGVSNGFLATY